MPNRLANSLIPVLGPLALALSFSACGPAGENGAQAAADAGRDGAVRDIATLDICSLVPVADVAEVLGHEPAAGSATATLGRFATDCTYSFQRDDGFSDHAIVWAYPPELWAPELETEAEQISGLGTAAYRTSLANFAQVQVLFEDDIFIDTRANSPVQARALAELAIERLAASGGRR